MTKSHHLVIRMLSSGEKNSKASKRKDEQTAKKMDKAAAKMEILSGGEGKEAEGSTKLRWGFRGFTSLLPKCRSNHAMPLKPLPQSQVRAAPDL